MKQKIGIIITVLFLSSITGYCQVEYMRLSPAQKIIQRVGATDIEIEFSRPQMKERKIFGELVPYGKMWRTGANENTTLSFSHRVKIGTTEVEAGKYALLTKPMVDKWEIYFYTNTNNLDVPNPIDSSKLIYLATVEPKNVQESEETLVINIYDITETTANLGINWEKLEVRFPIIFYTREAMEKKIEKELKQNVFDYSIAASYYYQRDIELEKARKYQELAMELKEKTSSWDYHSYGIILQKIGDEHAAFENIKLSLKLAKESNNNFLIEENEKLLKIWNKK